MFRRFTVAARETVVRAKHAAQQLHHAQIGSEHLLLALASPEAGVTHQVLLAAGLSEQRVRDDLVRLAEATPAPLTEEDATALRSIGIDLDAVLARIEESHGPDALRPPASPPQRESVWGR